MRWRAQQVPLGPARSAHCFCFVVRRSLPLSSDARFLFAVAKFLTSAVFVAAMAHLAPAAIIPTAAVFATIAAYATAKAVVCRTL